MTGQYPPPAGSPAAEYICALEAIVRSLAGLCDSGAVSCLLHEGSGRVVPELELSGFRRGVLERILQG